MAKFLSRLERIVSSWPLVPERGGRDFGEYLRVQYHQRFKALAEGGFEQVTLASCCSGSSYQNMMAEKELQALKLLSENHYKKKVPFISMLFFVLTLCSTSERRQTFRVRKANGDFHSCRLVSAFLHEEIIKLMV